MSPFQTLVILILVVPPVIAATIIGRRKGRPWAGFLLGLFLSWIGVILIAVTSPTYDALVRQEKERLRVESEARG